MVHIKLNSSIGFDPQKLIDGKLLIQANSGGGKSWAIRRIIEQSYGKFQIIVLDPEGEFSTLREHYDFVLAGKGGDTPADPKSASLLARKLLEENVSAIVDLYELHPQERKKFVRYFLDSMVNAPKELYHNVLVILDEAHMFVPEKEESEASNAVIDMASRGRKRGYSLVLATQRISKLNKDAAAECNNKLIGRTSLDIDRKRAGDELGITNKEDVLALRSLSPGEFFAFGPAISDTVIRVKIGEVKTSHPKAGSGFKVKVAPPTERIKKILAKLADLPAEAEQEARTVAELKAEIRTLKGHKCPKVSSQEDIDRAVSTALKQKDKEMFAERGQFIKHMGTLFKTIENIGKQVAEVLTTKETAMKEIEQELDITASPGVITQSVKFPIPKDYYKPLEQKVKFHPEEKQSSIGMGERKILIAIAQYPNEGMTREHLTVVTGYKSSSRNAYIQRLTSKNLATVINGYVRITMEGAQELGDDYEPLPIGEDLQRHFMNTLPEGEKRILAVLIGAYPQSVDREELSNSTGYKSSSRNAYIQRLNARQLVVYEGQGKVIASDKLF